MYTQGGNKGKTRGRNVIFGGGGDANVVSET
jgi:hypothetical protein